MDQLVNRFVLNLCQTIFERAPARSCEEGYDNAQSCQKQIRFIHRFVLSALNADDLVQEVLTPDDDEVPPQRDQLEAIIRRKLQHSPSALSALNVILSSSVVKRKAELLQLLDLLSSDFPLEPENVQHPTVTDEAFPLRETSSSSDPIPSHVLISQENAPPTSPVVLQDSQVPQETDEPSSSGFSESSHHTGGNELSQQTSLSPPEEIGNVNDVPSTDVLEPIGKDRAAQHDPRAAQHDSRAGQHDSRAGQHDPRAVPLDIARSEGGLKPGGQLRPSRDATGKDSRPSGAPQPDLSPSEISLEMELRTSSSSASLRMAQLRKRPSNYASPATESISLEGQTTPVHTSRTDKPLKSIGSGRNDSTIFPKRTDEKLETRNDTDLRLNEQSEPWSDETANELAVQVPGKGSLNDRVEHDQDRSQNGLSRDGLSRDGLSRDGLSRDGFGQEAPSGEHSSRSEKVDRREAQTLIRHEDIVIRRVEETINRTINENGDGSVRASDGPSRASELSPSDNLRSPDSRRKLNESPTRRRKPQTDRRKLKGTLDDGYHRSFDDRGSFEEPESRARGRRDGSGVPMASQDHRPISDSTGDSLFPPSAPGYRSSTAAYPILPPETRSSSVPHSSERPFRRKVDSTESSSPHPEEQSRLVTEIPPHGRHPAFEQARTMSLESEDLQSQKARRRAADTGPLDRKESSQQESSQQDSSHRPSGQRGSSRKGGSQREPNRRQEESLEDQWDDSGSRDASGRRDGAGRRDGSGRRRGPSEGFDGFGSRDDSGGRSDPVSTERRHKRDEVRPGERHSIEERPVKFEDESSSGVSPIRRKRPEGDDGRKWKDPPNDTSGRHSDGKYSRHPLPDGRSDARYSDGLDPRISLPKIPKRPDSISLDLDSSSSGLPPPKRRISDSSSLQDGRQDARHGRGSTASFGAGSRIPVQSVRLIGTPETGVDSPTPPDRRIYSPELGARRNRPETPEQDLRLSSSCSSSIQRVRVTPMAKNRIDAAEAIDEAIKRDAVSVIRDVLFCLQGVDGQHIKYDHQRERYLIRRDVPLPKPLRLLGTRMVSAGNCFMQLQKAGSTAGLTDGRFQAPTSSETEPTEASSKWRLPGGLIEASYKIRDILAGPMTYRSQIPRLYPFLRFVHITSLVVLAFLNGVREQLNLYYQDLSDLEAQLSAFETKDGVLDGMPGARIAFNSKTLRGLLVRLRPILRRIYAITWCVSVTAGTIGGEFLTILDETRKHGDPSHAYTADNLMRCAIEPLLAFCQDWIIEGKLFDEYGEFFILQNEGPPFSNWRDCIVIEWAFVPGFFDEDLTKGIVSLGKTGYFIRLVKGPTHFDGLKRCIQDGLERSETDKQSTIAETTMSVDFQLAPTQTSDPTQNLITILTNNMRQAAAHHRQELKRILIDEFLLLQHLEALHFFVLLGAGDFAEELYKYTTDLILSLGNVEGVVQSEIDLCLIKAIDSSIHKSCGRFALQHLKAIRMAPDERYGSSGWDYFAIDYRLQKHPLSVILSEEVIKQYRRLFSFLWKVRRITRQQQSVWLATMKNQFLLVSPCAAEVLVETQGLRAELLHLLQALEAYLYHDVLGPAQSLLVEQIREDKWQGLDELIDMQENFIQTLLYGTFMEEWPQPKTVLQGTGDPPRELELEPPSVCTSPGWTVKPRGLPKAFERTVLDPAVSLDRPDDESNQGEPMKGWQLIDDLLETSSQFCVLLDILQTEVYLHLQSTESPTAETMAFSEAHLLQLTALKQRTYEGMARLGEFLRNIRDTHRSEPIRSLLVQLDMTEFYGRLNAH